MSSWNQIFGIIGTAGLTLCGVPQVLQARRDGHANGLSYGFLYTWLVGEVAMFVYNFRYSDVYYFTNYGLCILNVAWLLRHKHFPRCR